MKRKIVCLITIIAVFSLVGCGKQQTKADIALEITSPCDEFATIAEGRDIKVMGNIKGEVPEDAIVKVSLIDEDGTELRYAQGDRNNIYAVSTDWYKGPVVQLADEYKMSEIAYTAPELVNLKGKSPHDATTKCVWTDDSFAALVTSATDKKHGLYCDDYFNLVNENGDAYDAFPEGKYTVQAIISDKDGNVLAEQEKQISIGGSKSTLILRGGSNDMRKLMEKWAIDHESMVLGDLLPGMYGPYYQLSTLAMSYAAEGSEYMSVPVTTMLYNITESSTSYGMELASFVQKPHRTDDSNEAQYYCADIGEFKIADTKCKLVKMPENKMHICRVDAVSEDAEDGVFIMDGHQIADTDLCGDDGWTVSAGNKIAIMGVTAPYQLDDSEIVPNEEKFGFFDYRNGIDTLQFTFESEEKSFTETRKMGMYRLEKAGDEESRCVYEFYSMFDSKLFKSGETYKVTIAAYDRNSELVPSVHNEFEMTVQSEHCTK